MIIRTCNQGGTRSRALYSDCETYRYLLRRDWACTDRHLVYILLNPSTATEEKNDATIERCERRARAGGFSGFSVANLFGLRATDPRALRQCPDPVGPENDVILANIVREKPVILCGWGVHGALDGRGDAVAALLRQSGAGLCHLGLTKAGHPRHPLYVSYAQKPQPWATS